MQLRKFNGLQIYSFDRFCIRNHQIKFGYQNHEEKRAEDQHTSQE